MNRTILLTLSVLTLAAAGCQTPEGARTPVNTTRHNLEDSEVFVLMDGPTQRSVTTSGVQQRINADGRLEVAANVRNREARRIEVQWQVVFKDAQGFSIGDETPWQTLILTENAQETLRAIAMNEQARRYTFRIRQAR